MATVEHSIIKSARSFSTDVYNTVTSFIIHGCREIITEDFTEKKKHRILSVKISDKLCFDFKTRYFYNVTWRMPRRCFDTNANDKLSNTKKKVLARAYICASVKDDKLQGRTIIGNES